MFKVGVIGCGAIATKAHLPVLSRIQDVKVVAVADINIEKAKRCAKKFGVPKVFNNLEDLLDEVDIICLLYTSPSPRDRG